MFRKRVHRSFVYQSARSFSLRRPFLFSFLLVSLLLGQVLSSGNFSVTPVFAQSIAQARSSRPSLTYAKYLAEGRHDHAYHGPLIINQKPPALHGAPTPHYPNYGQLPAGAEPPTMKSLVVPLSPVYFATGKGSGSPLALRGSDGRLEVSIQPGTFDLSHATIVGGHAPKGNLSLRFVQLAGHFVGMLTQLGTYQLQLIDVHGHVVIGIELRVPITFIYHYASGELTAYGLDPNHLSMTWPVLLEAAYKTHAPAAAYSISLINDANHRTLTAQSSILDSTILEIGVGDPSNQSPPPLHLASMQSNNGQLTYNYPLQIAPGSGGFAPQLQLQYSTAGPNERHSLTSPAADQGDGWNLSLGSISTETIGSTTWYFLNDVAGVGDRLVQQGTSNFYDTQHISYLKIQVINPGTSTQCFHVWDKTGTYYELGCTSDSLEYWTDTSGGRHNYMWEVNKIVAPNEGASATTFREAWITYLQDSYQFTSGGHQYTSIRDAGIEQILYGTSNNPNNPPSGSTGTTAGTIDFHYKAPTAHGTWADAYGTNYNCTGNPPDGTSTTLRCDDPIQKSGTGTFTAPDTFSSLSLQYLTSYVGDDSTASHAANRYDFTYSDTPYVDCTDPTSGKPGYCAGDHVLMSVTPTVYQNGTANQLKGTVFGYTTPQNNTYYDSVDMVGNNPYQVTTSWKYLNFFFDNDTGVGEHISYYIAYNNAHGTPTDTNSQGFIVDNRYDPFYCPNHQNSVPSLQCTGNYAHPDDHAWSEQVVTQIQAWGQDSSSTQLQPANTQYSYRLIKTGTWDGKTTWCYPDQTQQDKDCVGDNWLPSGDTSWQDYFHTEYQGFGQVYITSPSNDLTVDTYYSTKGWNTAWSDPNNFLGGSLSEEDIYSGNSTTSSALLRKTVNTYAANSNACRSTTAPYPACEIVLQSTQTTSYELTGSGNSNAPSVTQSYTYDDYTTSGGLAGIGSKVYHNVTQKTITGTDLPQTSPNNIYPLTEKWTYATNDQTVGQFTYYTVDTASHSELDDSKGTIWQCQYTTYDEGSGVTPVSAGWPTTVKTYSSSNCAGQTNPLTTSYTDYDVYGNAVATVDPVGAATPSLYSSNGCTVASGTISIASTVWTAGRYTTCATYDATHFHAVAVGTTNAFGQNTTFGYDTTQGDALTSITDPNNQQTTYSYSYASGNRTVQAQLPLHTGSYTKKSSTNSSCTTSSTLPCYEIDTVSYQYNTVTARTFYDSLGRTVETRTPGPTNGYDTVVFTTYNDQTHSTFKSEPFVVTSGGGWVDPNGAKDYQGNTPGGTATYYDALGRVVAVQDPMFGQGNDGIACSATISGNFTACTNYSLGQVSGDSFYYVTATAVDPNKHVTVTDLDVLGRTVYTQYNSGLYGGTLSVNEKEATQYNALDKATSVTVTDLAPQSGQSVTSVTTTSNYDSLGRLTSLSDPDRGTHTYTYDPDGRVIEDVSGSRTVGYVYDLLGREGCVQDAAPSYSPSGACTSGANPYVQNTYDTSKLTISGTTDYPVGQLTQSVSTTYFSGSAASVTESFEHDARGRATGEQMQFSLPSGWNVTTALPTYQVQESYNDANQPTTTTTSTIPSGQGFTTTQVYDSTTGTQTGLSNNGTATANLATLSFNAQAQISSINFLTSSGGALAADALGYDGNLRLQSIASSWQGGSGNSGTIFSQNLTYDPASNVISNSTTLAAVGSKAGGSETSNFCYDEQNRLVWAGNSGTQPSAGNGTCGSATLASGISGAAYNSSYVYTHLGQLWQGPLSGGGNYQYLYCNSQPHELTGLYAIGATCSNKTGQAYATSYDAFGNATSRIFSGTTGTLTYDILDHLTQWYASSNNQEQYLYDANGQRVLRRFTNGSGTSIITFAFGVEEHQYSGSGSNQWNIYYYFLAGRLLGSLDGNGTQFYLTDALGSLVSALNNAAGGASMKSNQLFGPYGNGRYYACCLNTAKGFIGQYNDGTGLDYFNARYYDPAAGVFLAADTVQGNLQGMNPYAYGNGNPETYSDPTGRYVVGSGGETYYPGSPFYTQGGEAYSIKTGKPYDLGGTYPGWYPGQGPNARITGNSGDRKTTPTAGKKSECGSVCLSNGHRWLDFLGKLVMLYGGGTALTQDITDLVKWIGIGVSAVIAQSWAQVIDAIIHVARDALSAVNMITTFLNIPLGSWAGPLKVAEWALDFIAPIADVAGFLLGFFSAPIKGIASKIFNNNPIINLMAKWGTGAIVKTIIRWSIGQNLPWLEQGMGEALSGASPALFCSTISAACENAPPSWVQ